MAALVLNRKIGITLIILLWIISILFFLGNFGSLLIIVHLPTVLPWSSKFLIISFILIFLCLALYILSNRAQWKSKAYMILLLFALSNTVISTIVFVKSRSIELNSNQAKESLDKALENINQQLQKSNNTK